MEHIEQAGVHSGDSACSLPPFSLSCPVAGRVAPSDHGNGARTQRGGPDERAVRHPERCRLVLEVNPRSVAHGSFRVQGYRDAPGKNCRPLHGRV